MTFLEALQSGQPLLTEGSLVERLTREMGVELDPWIANATLLRSEEGRDMLRELYLSYLASGREAGLPMVILTPTWRANAERMARAGVPEGDDLNTRAADFLKSVRDAMGDYTEQVFIGGLMGVRGDAYNPSEALPEQEALAFHTPQAKALAKAGVDFLVASTLPASSEAVGIARAMASTGTPYIPSFVVRPEGTLLDGTPLHTIVDRIDTEVSPSPAAFLLNCIHPSVYRAALAAEKEKGHDLTQRIIGLQANTSALSPEELDHLDHLESEAPEPFADEMLQVRLETGARILGGCCGTNAAHIEAIAQKICSTS